MVFRVQARNELVVPNIPRIRPNLGTVQMGTVNLGEKISLRVQHDPDNDQFIFQRDNDPEEFISYDVFGVLDPQFLVPANLSDNKRPIEFLFITPDCVGGARSESFMKVEVDKVYVNQSAVPAP